MRKVKNAGKDLTMILGSLISEEQDFQKIGGEGLITPIFDPSLSAHCLKCDCVSSHQDYRVSPLHPT